MRFRADDKVLFLAIPPVAELAPIARALLSGVVVALGTADDVEAARRAMAEFDNIMFVDSGPQSIPWREHYFTKIVVPPQFEGMMHVLSGELYRVLAPEGEIIRAATASV